MLAHLLDDLFGNACTLPGDDLLDERLDVGFCGHDFHGFLGGAIQRDSGDGAVPGVQLPACLDPPVDLLVPGLRHAIDPITQRPEDEDVVQRPARGLDCQATGLQGEPRHPHGPRVARSDHAHHGKARAIHLPAGRRSPPIRTAAAGRPEGRLDPWRVDPAPAPGLARCDPPNRRGLRARSAGCPGPDCRPLSRGPASRRGAAQQRRGAARSRSRRLPGCLSKCLQLSLSSFRTSDYHPSAYDNVIARGRNPEAILNLRTGLLRAATLAMTVVCQAHPADAGMGTRTPAPTCGVCRCGVTVTAGRMPTAQQGQLKGNQALAYLNA